MIKRRSFWLAVLGILLFGAVLAAGEGISTWLQGWLAFSLILGLVVSILAITWRAIIGKRIERSLLLAVAAALLVRIWVGATLTQLLPVLGYADSQEHQAGYAFTDAYLRDRQAWELANTGKPILSAFSGEYSSDQYGGMLALEAWLYRTLSLDDHRQTLAVIATAGAAAWGVIFLWKASQMWFSRRVVITAAWIFALFPESVLLGSSQMREAFVISAVAILFYSLASMQVNGKSGKTSLAWIGWLALGVFLLGIFQPPILIIALSILFGLWLLDSHNRLYRKQPRAIIAGILIASLLIVALLVAASIWANLPSLRGSGTLGIFGDWLSNNFAFQTYLTERASGMFQKLLETVGEQWTWLIVMVYGIAQPVLPAIVGDPDAVAIMRWIGFLRAVGWYALAPLLVYGTWAALRAKGETRRAQLIFLSLSVWGLAIIAAFNGGADQWDTPRYRTLLLAWQALLAGWALAWAHIKRDAWLWRWLAVELVFVGMFTEWYASRYYPSWPHFDIFTMIIVTLLLSGLILGGGWWWDRRRQHAKEERRIY